MTKQFSATNKNEDQFRDSDSHKNGVSTKFIQQVLDDYKESREEKGASS